MFTGYEHLIGGICGGISSTLICHPFDLLKIRYSGKLNSGILNIVNIKIIFVNNIKLFYVNFFLCH